jgi:uncharacterized protein
MITEARTARPSISLGGTDYYQSLAPYFISMAYTDACDGKKADDLNIELADRDGKFISTWMPKKGATLDAGIIAERWFSPVSAAISLDCGTFWIDTIEFELPGRKVSVKATSIPTNTRIKASKESRGWEKSTLKDIANQIAGENGMSIDWQADRNPRYSRVEQIEESGLGFLQKRANDAKLAIKVHRNKIVVFDEQKLEEAEAKFSLLYGNTPAQSGLACYRMGGGHFASKLMDATKKAKVSHTDVTSGDVKSGEWTSTPDNGDGGDGDDQTDDKVNENPDGDDDEPSTEAEGRELSGDWGSGDGDAASTVKAKSHVRDKNKKKEQSRVELSIGNPLVAAGMTFNLVGVGQFDGKWFIESAHHSIGPEYKTELQIRRCLSGY